MATADLVIRLITDTSQMRGLDEAQGKFGQVGAGLKKMAVPAGLALAGIAAFGKGAVDAASRVEQAMGAVDSVFGKSADRVKGWAEEAATSVALPKAAYAELATVMGAQLKNMGIPMDQVAGKTNDLIKLGADLAATYGGTTQEAVEALGSAFRGETDPIERYGVSIKEADIQAQMAKDGTDKLTGSAEKQAKAMAVLSLMSKQTADAQGAFGRESGTAAQTAQVASAQFEDMQATLGEALLPVVSVLAEKLGQLAKWIAKNKTATLVIVGAIAALAAAILIANAALTVYTVVTTIAASTTAMAWLAAIWPILAVVAAVALLAGGIVLLWKKSETFRTIVLAVWGAVKRVATATWRAIVSGGKALWSALRGGFKAVQAAAKASWAAIRSVAQTVWKAISSAAKAMASTLRGIWQAIKSAWKSMTDAVKSVWRSMISTILSVVRNFASAARSAWGNVRDAVSLVVDKVRDLVGWVKDIQVPGALKDAFNTVKGIVDQVISSVKSLVTWIKNIPVPNIDWPSPPSWLGKVIPGGLAMPVAPGVGTYAAPGVPARATTQARSGRTVNITVQGALDPEATARQIQRILAGHDRRVGLRTR